MKELFRFRNVFLVLGSVAIVAFMYVSDPNPGYGRTLVFLASLATPVVAVLFAHFARKALFDYLDMGQLYRKAKETATGSGLVFLGVCIVVFGLLGLFGTQVNAQEVRTVVPQAALVHLPTLRQEVVTYYPNHPKPTSLLV